MNIALEAKNLSKSYPGGIKAVNDVSIQVREGICFGLLGPNGAGKTTTVEMLEGIKTPSSGDILFFSKPVDAQFRQEIGIQFQKTALQDFIKVGETLEMFHALYEQKADLQHIIQQCALQDLLDRDNRRLSGGQYQRLLLAIALVNKPRIIFMDEPTTGLDPQARRNFWALVSEIRESGTTIILTTHYMDEAEILCDEIAIMDQGKIIAQDAPDALLRQRYRRSIIEIPVNDCGNSEQLPEHRLNDIRNSYEFDTDDIQHTLASLEAANCSISNLRIRQPNLEDLFLDLTGHQLRG